MPKFLDKFSRAKLLEDIDARVERHVARSSKELIRQIKASESRIENRVSQRVARRAWGDYREVPDGPMPVPELIAELTNGRKLNLGPGPKWQCSGWQTVDLYHEADFRLDFRTGTPLPFDDDSVSIVFASHVLEHLSDESAEYLLGECARVLGSPGLIRIITPCADKAMLAYRLRDEGFFEGGGVSCRGDHLEDLLVSFFASYRHGDYSGGPRLEVERVKAQLDANRDPLAFARWCVAQIPDEAEYRAHINAYTYSKLSELLYAAGFQSIAPSSYRQSVVPELRGPDFDNRPNVSLYVEALC